MITNIEWERANIIITVDKLIKPFNVYLKNEDNIIPLTNIKNNKIKINVTNVLDGIMLDKGQWTICNNNNNLKIDEQKLSSLKDCSRVFKYQEKYAYIVDFDILDNMDLIIDIDYYKKNKKYNKPYTLDNLSNSIKRGVLNSYYKLISCLIFKSKTLLLSENKDVLSDNLYAIYNELKNDKYPLKVYTINRYKNKSSLISIFKEIYYIALSKTIIIDNYTPILTYLNISKKTKIIQLWHAGVGFKAVGYARFGLKGSPYPSFSSHRKYDLVIVNEDKLVDIYQEVFGIEHKKIKPYGMPRLNNYLNKEHMNNIVNKLYDMNPDLKENKIILFSPTYRGVGQKDAYYDYTKIDLEKIYDFCLKNNFLFIIKEHPFINNKINVPKKYEKVILNYSNMDINELIYISDIMITDYSSCAYEFSFFNRPIIFYRYDKNLYEYQRTIHTLDVFSNTQYEVTDFDECLKVLNKYKNISVNKRFDNIKNMKKNVTYDIIKKIINGEDYDTDNT